MCVDRRGSTRKPSRDEPLTIHENKLFFSATEEFPHRSMTKRRKHELAEKTALAKIIRQPALEEADRIARSQRVFDHVLKNSGGIGKPDFQTISPADLGELFQITDELFFEGLVGTVCERTSVRPLSFRLSTRMTSTGGMTTMQYLARKRNSPVEFEIAIATTPLFESFRDSNHAIVGGVRCRNRLEALQRIMEHEMIHLIELLLTRDSNCSAAPFKRIVRNFFGHTQSNHRLLTPSDTARNRFGISPGDHVRFESDGQTLKGILQRVTKRATVLVPNSKGAPYDDGCRYSKYYVPLTSLRRA